MGFSYSTQFKILKKKHFEKGERDEVALWTISHESMYMLRLNHPIYLLTGLKLQYLLPAKAANFPLQKDADYETEIGIALSSALTYVLPSRHFLTLRIDRWRGTKTTRFMGIEGALGFSYALP